jgi:hypothetical protein
MNASINWMAMIAAFVLSVLGSMSFAVLIS